MNLQDLDRLPPNVAAKIEPVPPSECWVYTGATNSSGYGTASVTLVANGGWRSWLVHRLVYEVLVGPIPIGMTIDHLCRIRTCVNTAHMEVVSQRVNNLRGDTLAARWAKRTHCEKCGAELGPVNAHRKRGCKPCWTAYVKIQSHKSHLRKKARRAAARSATAERG